VNTAPAPLPERLLFGAHPRATLARAGVSDRELRGPLWTGVNRGLWAWLPGDPPAIEQRIRQVVPLVRPGGAIGGWAAAWLHGAGWLDGEGFTGEPRPVLLCLPPAVHCERRRGDQVFRSVLEPHEIGRVAGIPVTAPLRTSVDLVRLTRPWQEAVVAADSLRAAGLLDLLSAGHWLDRHAGSRGVPQARQVLALSREGVKSPQESRLRLVWTLEAGLPDPLVNRHIWHREGNLLGEADLVEPESGLVAEFDGRHHADAAQRGVDNARRDAMRLAGLTVVVVTAPGLTTWRRRTVHELRSAWAAAVARDAAGDAWFIRRPGV